MIPVKDKFEVESNLEGEEVYATIGDPRMVMKSLTKLYSNTSLATIREYSTNARDANVEAGRAEVPIEVSLPTILNPYFIVSDTGVGLSESELKAVYVSYGTSTKRNSNDFNGMLGFGSKSALAYTNSFTIIAVKNGMETIAVVTRKPDYSVALKVVATRKTTARNGVTIKVPVQEPEAFRRIAMDFYRFWQPGTILVDGAEPVQAVGRKIGDNLYYSTDSGTSYVVMGNVGYRIENPSVLFKRTNPVSFVAYVENGSVEFTPSREDLEYSETTKATLHKVIGDFEEAIYQQGKKEIEAETDPFEAYSKWIEWSERLGMNMFAEVEFNGEKFQDKIDFVEGFRYNHSTYRRYNVDLLRGNVSWNKISVKSVNGNLLITNYTADKLHSAHKAKIKEYLSLNSITTGGYVYLIDGDNTNQWVNNTRVVSWEDLLAAIPKKPRKPRGAPGISGRIPGSFDRWDEKGIYREGVELEDVPVFWISVADEKPIYIPAIINYFKYKKVKGFDDKLAVVKLSANRIDKFKRNNPKTQNLMELITKHEVTDGESLLSDDAKTLMKIKDSSWYSSILSFKNVDDPEWNRLASLLAKEQELMLDYEKSREFMKSIGKRFFFKEYRPGRLSVDFDTRYPLLAYHIGRYDFSGHLEAEWVTYMNDTYKRKVKRV